MFFVQFKCAPEHNILNRSETQIMTEHLRTKYTGVKSCIVGNHTCGGRRPLVAGCGTSEDLRWSYPQFVKWQ